MTVFIAGPPVAQPRARSKQFGKGVYDPGTADGWKTQVALAVRGLAQRRSAVCIDLNFRFSRPKSHYTGKGALKARAPLFHVSKPDVDNLAKSTLDAMVDAGFLIDDRTVVSLTVTKRWVELSAPQGCEAVIEDKGGVL